MKKCQFCAEEIQDEATVCRFCQKQVANPSGGWAMVVALSVAALLVMLLGVAMVGPRSSPNQVTTSVTTAPPAAVPTPPLAASPAAPSVLPSATQVVRSPDPKPRVVVADQKPRKPAVAARPKKAAAKRVGAPVKAGDPLPPPPSGPEADPDHDVTVEITGTDGTIFSGSYGDASGQQSVEGVIPATFHIYGARSVVSCCFQIRSKDGFMDVSISGCGASESRSTSATYGVATVTATLDH